MLGAGSMGGGVIQENRALGCTQEAGQVLAPDGCCCWESRGRAPGQRTRPSVLPLHFC